MNKNILKLYVNKKLICKNLSHSTLLFSFLGKVKKESTPYVSAVFQKYNFDAKYYQITDDQKDADFYFIPHNYWMLEKMAPNYLKEFVNDAEKCKKPVLIDAYGDSDREIKIKNSFILRTSQYRFKIKSNEVIMPAYVEDFLGSFFNNNLSVRDKRGVPSVGFAGYASLSFSCYVKSIIKELPIIFISLFVKKRGCLRRGIFFRKKAIKYLSRSTVIKSNFIVRGFYSGHSGTIKGDAREIRREFVDNMADSDYALCVKGDGNFSYRFFEALSLGRIPLVVDTDCVFPLENIINYKEFCIFVDARDLRKIGEIVRGFNDSVDDDQFKKMQRKAREAFEKYLRIDVFTKYMVNELNTFLANKK